MRKTFVVAAMLVFAASPCWSQSSSRDRDDDGRGWRENRSWDGEPGRWRGRVMQDENRGGERSVRGARFFLRSGDTRLRIVCSDQESTQTCVDAAVRLFERVQAASPRTSTSTPGTAPSAQ